MILNHIDEGLLRRGYLGVDIFFVISGFVITGSLAAGTVTAIGPWLADFYARRITPALLLCVLLTTLMAQLLIAPVHSEFDRNLGTRIGAIFGVSNLVPRSPSAHYFADAVQLNVFTHPWSLGWRSSFIWYSRCWCWPAA